MTESHPIQHRPGWYNKYSQYLKERFGERVQKLPLSLGLPCPNKDGTISDSGCIFCDDWGGGPLENSRLTLPEQLAMGLARIRKKWGDVKLIAYFQANTSTAAPLDFFNAAVEQVLNHPQVVGLAIGTRPDCMPPPYLDYLEGLAARTFLWVELGLQSIRKQSLEFLRRHHTLDDFEQAFRSLKERNIPVCVHLILGIPGEDEAQAIETARYISAIRADGVKIHPLHVLKNTHLERLYSEGAYSPLILAEYMRLCAAFLEHLSAEIIVQRITGERERELFVAPEWAQSKGLVMRLIVQELEKKSSWQGKGCIS